MFSLLKLKRFYTQTGKIELLAGCNVLFTFVQQYSYVARVTWLVLKFVQQLSLVSGINASRIAKSGRKAVIAHFPSAHNRQ